jgi:hypothetical protein
VRSLPVYVLRSWMQLQVRPVGIPGYPGGSITVLFRGGLIAGNRRSMELQIRDQRKMVGGDARQRTVVRCQPV